MYIILVIFVLGIVYFVVGAMVSRNLRIRELEISNEKAKRLKGFKIVLLSDLHGRTIGKNQDKLTEAILSQSPNIIIMAGDMVDAYDKDANAAVKLCENLSGKADIIAIRGNHFYKADDSVQDEMESAFDRLGVITLKNERKYIQYKDVKICIDGLDDPIASVKYKDTRKKEQLKRNRAAVKIALNKMVNEKMLGDYKIIVCHRPTEVDLFVKAGYDLALSGHTHGGQWGLPFGIEILGDEAKLFPPQDMQSGVHTHNKMPLIITSGIGYSNLKLRTFMPPEIVVITFK